jgi:hypothetical protein
MNDALGARACLRESAEREPAPARPAVLPARVYARV